MVLFDLCEELKSCEDFAKRHSSIVGMMSDRPQTLSKHLTKLRAIAPYVEQAIKAAIGIEREIEIPCEYFSLIPDDKVQELCYIWGPVDVAASNLAERIPLGEFIAERDSFRALTDKYSVGSGIIFDLKENIPESYEVWKNRRVHFEIPALWRILCIMHSRLRRIRM